MIRIFQTTFFYQTNFIGITNRYKQQRYFTCSSSVDKQKLRDQAIQRFVTRLSLPDGFVFKLIHCHENANESLAQKFYAKIQTHKILQLYHAIRDGAKSLKGMDVAESICNNGFRIGPAGNKGRGVYLANHSRYSWNWASMENPVLICDVIADSRLVTRHRSEILSPIMNSEYVVCDPELVFPRYVLEYKVEGEITDDILDRIGYVQHGKFGCTPCDSYEGSWKGKRCDCKLDPMIDFRDVTNY